MKITNNGTTADRLISGSSEIAGSFQVHEMTMEKGVAKMRPVKDGLEIKPGQTVELKPGAIHIMFVDLKMPLNKGDHIKATLVFEKAGTVEVEYDVLAIGASPNREPRASKCIIIEPACFRQDGEAMHQYQTALARWRVNSGGLSAVTALLVWSNGSVAQMLHEHSGSMP